MLTSLCISWQRWEAKLKQSGTFSADQQEIGTVSNIGGGQSIMAAQYAQPVPATAAARSVGERVLPMARAIEGENVGFVLDPEMDVAGTLRGQQFYNDGVISDGMPDAQIVSVHMLTLPPCASPTDGAIADALICV